MNKTMNVKKQITFRQWSRKSYAIFNSLKSLIKISVLSAAYTLVNPVQECKAQSDSTGIVKKVELDEVEVSGQRAPVVYSQLARIVSVITRSEIGQAPAQSINELLENIPQVDIRQRGTNGVQADISIQGGSFDQTLILLNGINLTDPQTGHHNLNLPLDLSVIDRVEILKGPASRVFGPNAFAGAVNFITGETKTNSVYASYTRGDFGLYKVNTGINHKLGNLSNHLSISKNACNGYISNTDYDMLNAFYHGKYAIKNNNIGLQLGYMQKDFGANSFYSPKLPNQFESNTTYIGAVNGNFGSTLKIVPAIYWRRNYDKFIYDRTNPISAGNYHYTDVYGINLNITYSWLCGKTSLGADYRKEIIYSTGLGKPVSQDKQQKISGENDKYYTFSDGRDNTSIFAEHTISANNLNVSAGLMVNNNTALSGIGLFPGIDISYKLTNFAKIYVTTNRSLRLPTFTNLYYSSKSQQILGNTELNPEKAWIAEAGIKSGFNEITSTFSYFHKWGTEAIDYIWRDTVWHAENITTLNTDGLEASVNYNPQNSNIVRQFSVSYSLVLINKASGEFRSMYILDHLKHKVTVSLSHKIYKNIGGYWQCSLQERNGYYDKWNPADSKYTQKAYGSHVLLDGRIYWQNKSLKVFAEGTNLLNSNYIDLGNITQPGIWIKGGFEVKINYGKKS
jgi:iron complex outermembrane receptor protein